MQPHAGHDQHRKPHQQLPAAADRREALRQQLHGQRPRLNQHMVQLSPAHPAADVQHVVIAEQHGQKAVARFIKGQEKQHFPGRKAAHPLKTHRQQHQSRQISDAQHHVHRQQNQRIAAVLQKPLQIHAPVQPVQAK